jgi:hypothetical protein
MPQVHSAYDAPEISAKSRSLGHVPIIEANPRRGNFASKDMLKTTIDQFIAYFNATMAKPFRWTYAEKPLAHYRLHYKINDASSHQTRKSRDG